MAVPILLACLCLSAGARGQSAFTAIDDTSAGSGAEQGTAVTAVDAAGDMAGVYIDTNNALHCFVLPAGGSISNCDVSGAGSSVGEGTFPTTINSSGVVAGSYIDGSQISHGFVRAVNGTITKFDAPLASQSKNRGTTVLSINDSGVIIGTYTTGTYATNSDYYGFMRSADGATYTSINDPNAGTSEGTNSKKQGTTPIAMNASGVITGYYIDSSNVQHGFVRSASGSYTQIDPTGVGTCVNQNNGSNFGGTSASGIDATGDVAGTYLDTSCVQHGFIRKSSGAITSFDAPGADTNPCTTGGGSGEKICGTFLVVSDAVGDLTGSYIDTNGTIRGFLRPAATGILTSFDDPNAYTSGSLNGTLGIAINSPTSGMEIAGTYLDANSLLHGFIYTPALTASTTTLTPAPTPNPSVYQEPVTLTASVSFSGGAPPNGENVTFMSGTTTLGTAQLTSGVASLTTTALPTGTDSITAVYGGDADFAGSTSTAVGQTVNKASSATTLKSSLNPSTFGQSVTFTANISGQFSGVATGTVTFSNGSSNLGSPSVSNNVATLTTTALPAGTDSITAVYNGDSNFTGSTSNTVSQVVNAAPPAPTISSLSPGFTSSGGTGFTLTVTGTGFVSSSSAVYWGSTALTTTYVSPTQLTAQVPASDIASSGTANITVQTPSPGGGTSNALVFEIDSGSSANGPTFTTITATVTPGATATYQVTLPSGASDVTVNCLNLPTGASCSYSASSGGVTIATSATTPAGTYQVIVVFTETLPGAATGLIILPILLLPLAWARRRWMRQRIWITVCLGIVIFTGAVGIGCGGSSTQKTHTVTSSGTVTLIVQ